MTTCFVTIVLVLFLVKSEAYNYGNIKYCSRSCPILPPGTIGPCIELCGDGCPPGEGCCSNGCGHTCQPLRPVKGYGDQCPKDPTVKNDIKYCSRSCPILPPGTIGPCIELCGDGCPPGEGCCSNGCGHTCQPLRPVKGYGDQCPKDPTVKNDIKYCSRSCPILPPGTIGPCIELCGDGCPPGEGCCSNGCGHTCQPLRPVKGYGDQCPKDPTVKNDDDLRYPSESYPDRWCSNECKVGEVCAGFVDGRFRCIRGNFAIPI
ncbi:WAP four-disulfide core domain protein 3-like isoform X3 [Artemia franciscana]|uniref:WAP four-disulfide core domain protein 3-like isoform X3 n=1 Tax=Artemia franciscana TaxID=6661 RepID=UPI0032DAE9E8